MTEREIIDGLLQREGGYRFVPGDRGGPTNHGITAETYGNWKGWTRAASAAEIQNMREIDARMIYFQRYIAQPGFTEDTIPFEPLRVQLIDFGVNSGPERAVRWLQRVLHVAATGHLDVPTRLALQAVQQHGYLPLLNDALVAARSYMIDRAADQGIIRAEDEEGVESRALSFFLAKP